MLCVCALITPTALFQFDILMSVCKPGEAVISKHLFFNPAPQVVWLVYVYPNGYQPEYRDNVCVFLDQVAPVVSLYISRWWV